MPRMSSTARDAARQVQVIAADASNGAALAARLLAALEPAVGFDDAEVIAVDPDSCYSPHCWRTAAIGCRPLPFSCGMSISSPGSRTG